MNQIPQKCISIAEAKKLQENWWKTRLEVTTNGQKHKDTCSFHFSVEEIQEYLNYVKERSAELNIKNPGINIWLGAYEARDNKPNLTTIFLSATRESSDESYEDGYEENEEIEPMNTVSGGWPPNRY